jgi:DNA-binding MarR family transcriptional regulator
MGWLPAQKNRDVCLMSRTDVKRLRSARRRRRPAAAASATPDRIDQIVDFRELMLHQVVSFSTRFVKTVADLYVSRHSISLPEMRALFLLGRFGALAPIRLAELADTDRATITRALAKLKRRKLVEVGPDGEHGKRTLARLSRSGIRLHNELAQLVNYRNQWLRNQFKADELKMLFALLTRLERLSGDLPMAIDEDSSVSREADRRTEFPGLGAA